MDYSGNVSHNDNAATNNISADKESCELEMFEQGLCSKLKISLTRPLFEGELDATRAKDCNTT